jgi:hypothetical protein
MKSNFFKKFFWSIIYSLPGTIAECAMLLFLLIGSAFLYSKGAPIEAIISIIFLSILGGQQFSREVIEKMKQKFGKDIF